MDRRCLNAIDPASPAVKAVRIGEPAILATTEYRVG